MFQTANQHEIWGFPAHIPARHRMACVDGEFDSHIAAERSARYPKYEVTVYSIHWYTYQVGMIQPFPLILKTPFETWFSGEFPHNWDRLWGV